MHWTNGSGLISLQITKAEAAQGHHRGDCQQDVRELSNKPRIRRQLDKLDPAQVKDELENWSDWDLSNHEDNLQKLLWIACGDIVEGNC